MQLPCAKYEIYLHAKKYSNLIRIQCRNISNVFRNTSQKLEENDNGTPLSPVIAHIPYVSPLLFLKKATALRIFLIFCNRNSFQAMIVADVRQDKQNFNIEPSLFQAEVF